MTSADYEKAIEVRIVQHGMKDAWVGDWLVRGVRRGQPSRLTGFVADHSARVGCTADTPQECARLMATWDAGMKAVES